MNDFPPEPEEPLDLIAPPDFSKGGEDVPSLLPTEELAIRDATRVAQAADLGHVDVELRHRFEQCLAASQAWLTMCDAGVGPRLTKATELNLLRQAVENELAGRGFNIGQMWPVGTAVRTAREEGIVETSGTIRRWAEPGVYEVQWQRQPSLWTLARQGNLRPIHQSVRVTTCPDCGQTTTAIIPAELHAVRRGELLSAAQVMRVELQRCCDGCWRTRQRLIELCGSVRPDVFPEPAGGVGAGDRIELRPLEQFALRCPHCHGRVIRGSSSTTRARHFGHYDGASVGIEPWSDFDGRGIQLLPDDEASPRWDVGENFGHCYHCAADITLVVVKITSARAPDPEWCRQYISDSFYYLGDRFKAVPVPPKNHVALLRQPPAGVPHSWVVSTYDTAVGGIHVHMIGPFARQATNRIFARDLVSKVWPQLRELSTSQVDGSSS